MQLGIDILLGERQHLLKGRRIGVLAHAASINADGLHTISRLLDAGLRIEAVFGPEHGLFTDTQDMEAVGQGVLPGTNIPVYSLYGTTLDSLKPTPQMLDKIDVLVIDLQDIGSRYYTYVWTACLSVETCAETKKEVYICDRPNPIGGVLVEGGGIEAGFESFVGLHPIPVRHGMTIGEVVGLVCAEEKISANISVIPIEGWRREMDLRDTECRWTNPSPNMRSYTAALLYPGMCLIEGTNVSEGRGTDTPFEIAGAPYIDSSKLVDGFNALGLPGMHAAPCAFIPTGQKWMGHYCNGMRWVVEDTNLFKPYLTGLAFVWLVHRLYKDSGFRWRETPYEFVTDKPAIDLLTGSATFRQGIEKFSLDDLKKFATTPIQMLDVRKRYLIY